MSGLLQAVHTSMFSECLLGKRLAGECLRTSLMLLEPRLYFHFSASNMQQYPYNCSAAAIYPLQPWLRTSCSSTAEESLARTKTYRNVTVNGCLPAVHWC